MHKLSCLLILSLLFSQSAFATYPTPPVEPKPLPSSADIARVEAEAKKAAQEKQKLEQQAQKIKDELSGVNKKMIEAAQKIQNCEDQVRKRQDELDALQKHLAESELKFQAEHDILIETLAALQNLALRPSEAVLVQPLSPVEVMRSSILLRGSVHALRERADMIRKGIEDINNQKNEIAKRLKDLEAQNKKLAKQQVEMKELSKQKSKMYNQIASQSREAQQRAEELAGQASSLRDLVDKLEKQKIQERQMAEKERLAKERAADEARENKFVGVATNFAKAQGKLFRPARGPIVTKFRQELSRGVVSNGIDIKTAPNAQVVAPYEGTVIFSGPFKSFANLLIIDHGDGYTSLLSGLEDTDTRVGQTLMAGEPVGTMPAGSTSKLHMEIRKNNHPVNPVDWISAQ